MDPRQLDGASLFVDENPDRQEDLFVDYNPDDLQKVETASLFVDNDPDALLKKQRKAADDPVIQKMRKAGIYAPDKTPEEINQMNMQEKIAYAKQLNQEFKYRQGKGFSKGAASGATFGLSEYIPGMNAEEDDMLNGFGEFIGSTLPISKLYNWMGKPLVSLAAKSPYAKNALMSFARMTGMGATGAVYEGTKEAIKEGKAPAPADVVQWGAQWALLDGALQAVGKGISFITKVRKVAKNAKNLNEQQVINDTISRLQKEKINPEVDPEKYANRAEEIVEEMAQRPFEFKVENESKSKKTSNDFKDSVKETSAENKEIPIEEEPKNKFKKKNFVDIPEEDVGKSASEVLEKHVQTGTEKTKRQRPDTAKILKVLETQFYNRFAPLEVLGEGETSILNKPGELAELVKGYQSTARSVLEMADYDVKTGLANGPGFKQIFSPKRLKELTGKKKLDRVAFDKYLFSKTSLERQAIGHKSAVPTKVAESFIRQNPQFEKLAEDVYSYGRNRISNLTKVGITTTEGEARMFKLYKSHAPLNRFLPEELTLAEQLKKDLTGKTPASEAAQTPGSNSINSINPLKKAKGSLLKSQSPTESMVKNTIAFENAIARNRAMKALGNRLKQSGYEVKEVSKSNRSKAEIQEILGDSEVFEVTDDLVPSLNEAIDIINPNMGSAEGKLRWYENGKLYEVKGVPKDVIQAVRGLDPQDANFVIKLIEKWKNFFTQGVVLQPGTLMRISGMDLMISTLQSKFPKYTGAKTLAELPTRIMYEYPRMLFNIIGKSDLFEKYMRSGGAQTSLQGLDREMLESMTDTLTNSAKRNDSLLKETLNAPRKIVRFIFKSLNKTGEVLGDVPRLLEFERSFDAAIQKGASSEEAMAQAAFDAFEVSVPYGRKGSSRSLNALYRMMPFVNTIVNSTASFVKTLNPNNPTFKSSVATATSYLTLPTLYYYLKNRNDPRYQALPQEDKDRNVYVYSTDDPNEEPLKMRKMWQYGWLFQTLPEHMMEFVLQKDPKAFDGLMKSFEEEFSPFTMLSFSNATEGGGFDFEKLLQGGRYNLIPERQKKIDKELQQTSSTSQTAKLLAKFFHTSPIYIDHIVNMTGGGLGKDVIRLADEAVYMTGIKDDKRPRKQSADSIFYGTFWGRGPSKRNEYTNKFYKYVDEMETRKQSAELLKKEGKQKEAEQYESQYIDLNNKRKTLGKYYKQIEEIRSKHPDDLDGVAKRKELDRIHLQMTEQCKEFVEEIEKELRERKKNSRKS